MATRKQARRKRALAAAHAPAPRRREEPEAARVAVAPAAAIATPAAPTRATRAGDRVDALVSLRAFPAVALGAIFALSVLVWGLVARAHSIPDVFPDEVIYANV